MVELLAHLGRNGFKNYIASGGGRDFMRPISQELYGIPREGVIGSTAELAYTSDERGGTITHRPNPTIWTTGHVKPIRIWSRIRPQAAAGRGQLERRYPDAPLHPTRHKPSMRLLVLHDDWLRASSITRPEPSNRSSKPDQSGWTIVSIADDWATVF